MLLGNLNFKNGKYMAALSFYSKAIKDLSEKQTQIKLDEFVAYHNRAVINFRLGDDDFGLSDIEKANKVNPGNLECKTLLSLAYRRMGRFKQAIENCVEMKQIRIDQQQKEAKFSPPKYLLSSHSGGQESAFHASNDGHVDSVSAAGNSNNNAYNEDTAKLSGKTDRENQKNSSGNNLTSPMANTQQENDRRTVAIEVVVPEPNLRNSFAHKKLEAIMSARQNKQDATGDSADGDAKGGGQLKAFKVRHGMRMELFQDLFVQPTELQRALLVEPNKR